MSIKATVLCENSVFYTRCLTAEHGWAVFLETPGGNFLWDTGQGLGILHNASILGVDLRSLDAILISHSHFDHTGGLEKVLEITGEIPVYAHPDIFVPTYDIKKGEAPVHVGIPFTREYLESIGARFNLSRSFREIVPGIFLSGEVPRVTDFEVGNDWPVQFEPDGKTIVNYVPDDQTLVVNTEHGLLILLGCAHSGIINVIDHIIEKCKCSRIAAIIGGTHLGPATPEQQNKSIQKLQEYDIERIGVSHCTSMSVCSQLSKVFTDRFFNCNVGTVINL